MICSHEAGDSDNISLFVNSTYTAQKAKFPNKYFFSKCDQIHRKLRFGHIYWRNT